jgi:hypothetical protein
LIREAAEQVNQQQMDELSQSTSDATLAPSVEPIDSTVTAASHAKATPTGKWASPKKMDTKKRAVSNLGKPLQT